MSGPALKAAVSLYSEAAARGDILGVVLLVARRGKVVLYESIGMRDREKNLPMEKDTPFQIMSMTKPVIASAALILTYQGKLRLDDPVSRYIPAFAHGRSREIKIRNLLNHTSGLRIPTNFVPKTDAEIADGSTLQREVARLPEIGPDETPGSSYEYSNPGYNTLAAVIEVASGKKIDVFLSESIFKPLKMNTTYSYWAVSRETDCLRSTRRKMERGKSYARITPPLLRVHPVWFRPRGTMPSSARCTSMRESMTVFAFWRRTPYDKRHRLLCGVR